MNQFYHRLAAHFPAGFPVVVDHGGTLANLGKPCQTCNRSVLDAHVAPGTGIHKCPRPKRMTHNSMNQPSHRIPTESAASQTPVEAQLHASEERLRLVLEVSGIGTFEVDLTTGEGQWNEMEFELLGLKPGAVQAGPEPFFRFVHPADLGLLQAQWQEALRCGTFDAEFRIIRADGELRWLAGKGQFIFESATDPQTAPRAVRFLGMNYDITERKQAEEKLRRNYVELRAMSEELVSFNNVAVGRELCMIELKKEINALCAVAGEPPRYALEFEEGPP